MKLKTTFLLLVFLSFIPKVVATDFYTASATATLAGNTGAVNANWTTNPDGLTGLTTVAIAATDNLIILSGGLVTINVPGSTMSVNNLTLNSGAKIIHANSGTANTFNINGTFAWNGIVKALQSSPASNFFKANGNITGNTAVYDNTSTRGVYIGVTGKTIALTQSLSQICVADGLTSTSMLDANNALGLLMNGNTTLGGDCTLYTPLVFNNPAILDLNGKNLKTTAIKLGNLATKVIKGHASSNLTIAGTTTGTNQATIITFSAVAGEAVLNQLNIDSSLDITATGNISITGNPTVNSLKFGSVTTGDNRTRILNVTGSFTVNNNINVRAKGITAGTLYDQLSVTGNITIGASTTLQVDIINSYNPLPGAIFNFAQSTAGTITGTFGTVQPTTGYTGTVSYPSANTVQCQLSPAQTLPDPVYQLDWTEDFSGSQLNLTDWSHRLQGVWRSATNDPTTVTVANSNMILQPYTDVVNGVTTHHAGEIATKRQFLYGRFEARIAMVNAPASWSAFWLQSNTNGNPIGNPKQAGMEMDIVESLPNDGKVHTNLHWDGYATDHKSTGIVTGDLGANSGNYHIYTMDWTPDYYKFYVDGNLTWTYTANISQTPEFMILSTEIEDGSWAGNIPLGGYGAQGQGSTKMQVDYVKYYSLPNNPPTVAITSPANNTNFNANSNITFTTNAADPDGQEITKVEFFRDAIKLGESSIAPYSFTWANAIGGNHIITAKATDSRGVSTTSSPVVVNVEGTSITSPANNSSFITPTNITITAGAVNANGTTKVEFFQGSTKLGEDLTAPYSYDWTNMPIGNYALTVKSTDNNSLVTTSDIVNVTVNRGITSWTTSRTDATISGTTATNWDDGTGNVTSFTINPSDSFTVLNGGIANINTTATTIGGALTINSGGTVNTNSTTTISGALAVTGALNVYATTSANGAITIDPTGSINHIATTACNFNGNGDIIWNGTIKAMKPTTGSSFFNLNGNITGTSAYLDTANNTGVYLAGNAGKTINLVMKAPTSPFAYGQFSGFQIAKDRVLAGNCKIYCPINYNQNCTLDLATYNLQVPSIQGGVATTRVVKGSAAASLTLSGAGNSVIFLDPTLTALNALNIDDSFNPGTTSTITITGNLAVNTLNFGTPTSTNTRSLVVNGNFALANNGTIHVQAKGTTAGIQYNQLKVQSGAALTPPTGPGNFSLGSNTTLQVDAINSYVPVPGDAYNLIPYAGTFGANNFATIINPSGYNGAVTSYTNPLTYTINNASLSVGDFEGDKVANKDIIFFPNPVKDILNIKINEFQPGTTLRLYNVNGLLVKSKKIDKNTQTISLAELATGLYFAHVENGGQVIVKKIVKQ
ncbi:Ig-like domain-containing protein [Flavobacterium sp. WC2509]|uniref:Ig-like domain-containing protein n=1 Tax=Flavobacterium sp. WC2509 TaxID=3461406 RepID=UPI004044F645